MTRTRKVKSPTLRMEREAWGTRKVQKQRAATRFFQRAPSGARTRSEPEGTVARERACERGPHR